MVELGKTPAMERLSIFGFTTSQCQPNTMETGVNIGAKLAGKLIKNGKAPIHLVHWVNGQKHEIYHKQNGESFRQWFNNRERWVISMDLQIAKIFLIN